jgi:hypothetical protein
MTELRIGSVVVDNDPRLPHRRGVVEEIEPNRVIVRWDKTGRTTKIARSRIAVFDDRPRRTGYTLVS